MKKIPKKISLILGFFFIVLELLVFYSLYNTGSYQNILWFCDHAPLLFAIAFLLRNPDLVKAFINIGLLGQLLWVLDFSSKLLLDTYVSGMTDYVFESEFGFWVFTPIMIHFFTSLLALYFTKDYSTRRITLVYSAIYILVIFGLLQIFTTPEENINCVYKVCTYNELTPSYYPTGWPLIVFTGLVLPTFYIQKGISYLVRKNKKRHKKIVPL